MKSYEQGKQEEVLFKALSDLAANGDYKKLQKGLVGIVKGARFPQLPDDLMYSLTLKVASVLMLGYITTFDELLKVIYDHSTSIAKRLCLIR